MRKQLGLVGATLAAAAMGVLVPGAASDATTDAPQATTGEYTNPIRGLGGACSDVDPYLVKGPNHTFYAYYSKTHGCVPHTPAPRCESPRQKAKSFQDTYWVYRSTDPTRWPSKPVAQAMTVCKVKRKDPYVTSLWGAGALYVKKTKTYYLFYTANEKRPSGRTKSIGVATSKSATGPFTNHGIIVRGHKDNRYYGVHPFLDPASGKIYLYFANHWKRIAVREFDPRTNRAPRPNTVVLGSGLRLDQGSACDKRTPSTKKAGHQTWEHCVLEHPEVFYAPLAPASHRYFMLYNGAGGGTRRYAIGYAYSSSPAKRFKRASPGTSLGANPIVHQPTASDKPFYGPGSPNTFMDGDNTRWLFYRYYPHIPGRTFAPRKMALSRLHRKGGRLFVTPTIGVVRPKPTW